MGDPGNCSPQTDPIGRQPDLVPSSPHTSVGMLAAEAGEVANMEGETR